MITNIRTISSNTFYPYFNMALEKYLFDQVKEETVILYLWQNEKTAVCGCDQNMDEEVSVDRLYEDGGYPARRLSPGNTFFMDKGTLNYTFLCKENQFDIDRQMQVIIKACSQCGLSVEQTSDYSLTIEQQPFSHSDFYQQGVRRYHHGRILIHRDDCNAADYLCKGEYPENQSGTQDSDCYLEVYRPELTVEILRSRLIQAFEEVYGQKASPIQARELEPAVIESYEKIFSDDSWLYQN